MRSNCSRYIGAVLIGQLCIGFSLKQAFGQELLVRDAEAQKTLVRRLVSGDEEQRMDAIIQLSGIFSATPGSADFSTVTALAIKLRTDTSPIVRALAARALEICGDTRASESLIAALGTERELAVRKAIIYALGRFPSREAALALIPLLKNKDWELRSAAAFALSEIRQPESVDALRELLQKRNKDEDAFARSLAARALGFIGDHEAIDLLITALTNDKSSQVRREAAQALGLLATLQDVKALQALREARFSSDPYLSMAAEAAIASINSRDH